MKIDERTYKAMPPHLQALFEKLPNPGSDEVLAGFPVTGPSPTGFITQGGKAGHGYDIGVSDGTRRTKFQGHGDAGSAARFFYCAKASRSEREAGIEGVTLELEACLCGANTEVVTLLERAISELVTDTGYQGCNTFWSGKRQMAQFHRVILSITSTGTSKTIDSKTWNVSTSQPTSEFIVAVIRTIAVSGLSLVGTVESISQSLNSMSEKAELARGAKIAVSETPLRISASAKPTRSSHPTVKPLSLMEYLCRLTRTPSGGVVLDPFMGSGTTGMACVKTGRDFIGIEIDAEYMEIARRRIAWAVQKVQEQAPEAEQLELLPKTGRWPANVVTDGSEEVVAGFPDVKGPGFYKHLGDSESTQERQGTIDFMGKLSLKNMRTKISQFSGDTGSAARFFAVCPPDDEDVP